MRAIQTTIVILVFAALCTAVAVAQTRAASVTFKVIVHPSNPTQSFGRKFLEDAFLKRATRWSHNEVIRPVDQRPDSAVRARFSEDVLNRSVEAVRSYWQQAIFSGRDLPPPELDSDEEVVRYVINHPGAVGYVSSTASLGGAKTVKVE